MDFKAIKQPKHDMSLLDKQRPLSMNSNILFIRTTLLPKYLHQ